MNIYFLLFYSFFKTGLFTFGGGLAMLPLLKEELVQKRGWLSDDELLNYFSVSECTPGIIAVNVATFTGYKLKKSLGAILATFSVVLPSVIIITLIASVFSNVTSLTSVQHILNGIKIGVSALLMKVSFDLGYHIFKKNHNKIFPALIFMSALFLIFICHLSCALIVLLALLLALGKFYFQRKKS